MKFDKFSRFAIGFILLFSSTLVFSQTKEREVFSAAGESFEQGKYQMDWTLGEPVIGIGESQSNIITQGFHQSVFVISSIEEQPVSFPQFSLFPNPATTHFFVEFTSLNSHKVEFFLSDISGQLVEQGVITKSKHKFDLQFLANTTYILKLQVPEMGVVRSFKIQKTQ